MPPAIQSTMMASAVGVMDSAGWLHAARGYPAASADRVAADADRRKSRRVVAGMSVNQLELRQHDHRPEQVFDSIGSRPRSQQLA
jgi:hypothetical protein